MTNLGAFKMRRWIKAACLCLLAAFAFTACDGNSKDGANGGDHRRNRGVASMFAEEFERRSDRDHRRNRDAASSDDIGADVRRDEDDKGGEGGKDNKDGKDDGENRGAASASGYLTKPFDPTATKLPRDFVGCDASEIYSAVSKEIKSDEWERGEYEKTGDYEERTTLMLANLGQKKLLGDLKFSSTLAFTLRSANLPDETGDDAALKTDYDADSETLTASADVMKIDSRWGLCLQKSLKRDDYVGENHFGVKKEILVLKTTECGVLFDERDTKGFEYSSKFVWRLNDVTPEKAKEIRDDLGAICVCKLRYQDRSVALGSDYSRSKPTMDLPLDSESFDFAVSVTQPEFWLYNVKTGEILAKWSWNETRASITKKIGDLTPSKLSEESETASVSKRDASDDEDADLESRLQAAMGTSGKGSDFDIQLVPLDPLAFDGTSGKGSDFDLQPFDPSCKTLPRRYRGHDPAAIYEAVAKLADEELWNKGEFEKTVEYQKRIKETWNSLQDKTLVGDVKFSSTLAFALIGDSSSGLIDRYDADSETLSVTAVVSDAYFGYRDRLHGLTFETKTKEIKVAFTESYGSYYFQLRDAKPDVARNLSGKVGVLCVCKLTYRKINDGLYRGPCAGSAAVLTTEPEFWLYNVETGDVLAKYSLREAQEKTPKTIGGKASKTAASTEKKDAAAKADSEESAEEQAAREAARAATQIAKERRRSAAFWQEGNRRLENRLDAVKKLKPSRELDAPTSIAVPENCATLQEALAEAAKAPYSGPIPRVALAAGEYDASGLVLKTSVDIQSATGNPADVVLKVDAASPIVVDGETVVEFDGATLRQVGSGEKAGCCVEVKRGIALFFNCVFDGKDGAKSATGVKAVGLKSAVVCGKCRASGFSLSALHVEDGAFAWASDSVLGPNNRFGASSKESRLEVENCELRGNDVGVYFGRIASGGARGNVYAENKRDAQVVESATVEVDAPDAKKTDGKK